MEIIESYRRYVVIENISIQSNVIRLFLNNEILFIIN